WSGSRWPRRWPCSTSAASFSAWRCGGTAARVADGGPEMVTLTCPECGYTTAATPIEAEARPGCLRCHLCPLRPAQPRGRGRRRKRPKPTVLIRRGAMRNIIGGTTLLILGPLLIALAVLTGFRSARLTVILLCGGAGACLSGLTMLILGLMNKSD